MAELTSICVYCGSALGTRPIFLEAARTLGADIAKAGLRLVYGGGDVGLMGAVARTVIEAGGHVTGIIPAFLMKRETMLEAVTDLTITADMHERKRLMFERSDAFVALPGGVGTLEELVEQMTWAQLGQHRKPILLANIDGYWTRLLDLLDHMREEGFIRQEYPVGVLVANRAADIVPMIEEALKERTSAELQSAIDPARL